MEKLPHPINEDGLPYIPAPYLIGCVETTPCSLREQGACFMDTHHIEPRRNWVTSIDHKYGEQPHNKQRMCRALHREFETTHEEPPAQSQEFKAGFLIASGVHLSKRVKEEIKRLRNGKN
jgi:hypothetical protein